MSTPEQLRGIVAGFLGLAPDQLEPHFPLGDRLRNSIVRAGLQARLHRELGLLPPPLVGIATYGQLEQSLLPGESAPAAGSARAATTARPLPRPAPGPQLAPAATGLSCGIDIESIASLPEAADYWTHPFYTDNFSPAEIAECVLNSSPREHFAARWSAKEALIKCDPTFRDAVLSGIEVRKDATGAPRLFDVSGVQPRPLPVAVSLAHAGGFAAAMVVAGQPAAAIPVPPAAVAHAPPADGWPRLIPWLALAAALAALVTAIGAWVR